MTRSFLVVFLILFCVTGFAQSGNSDEVLPVANVVKQTNVVVLKNPGQILPLKKNKQLLVVGQLAKEKALFSGEDKELASAESMSILDGIRNRAGRNAIVTYLEGCKAEGSDKGGFPTVLKTARRADAVIYVMCGQRDISRESVAEGTTYIPGVQTDLLEELAGLSIPVIVILVNGQSFNLSREIELADAVLDYSYPTSECRMMVADALFGSNKKRSSR